MQLEGLVAKGAQRAEKETINAAGGRGAGNQGDSLHAFWPGSVTKQLCRLEQVIYFLFAFLTLK